MVDKINNGEEGYSVREKLNTVIDRTNTLNGVENKVETNRQNIAKNKTEINNIWSHVGEIEGEIQDLDVSVLNAKIDQEITDRTEGDAALAEQITSVDTSLTDAIILGDAALQGQIDTISADLGDISAPEETDPTVPDHVKAISTDDISNWSASYSWGDHGDAGYLTDFTETDPVFSASPAAGITGTNISNWDTAHGWGNHASAGYATETWVNNKNYSTYTGSDAVKTSGDHTMSGSLDAKFFRAQADQWFMTLGTGGWSNETHGGGWYMTDATWIRAYGSKAVYVANSGSSAIATAGDVVAYYSDERLKDVKGRIENPLDKVDAIETFYYTHNDIAKELGYEGDDVQVGVSAQSVKAVMPEVVCRAPVDMDADGGSLTGEDYMTVKYERLVPLLLESIKELTARVKELESGS